MLSIETVFNLSFPLTQKKFITELLKSESHIGAVYPSSSFLVKKMLRPIDFKNVANIVEFGPGTGVFTFELLKKMPENSRLLTFEINKEFCNDLKKVNDQRLIVINDSAEKLDYYLELYGIEKTDYIISSLPFAVIPNETVQNILNISGQFLDPKGAFVQFQYSLNAYTKLKSVFNTIQIQFTLLNLPPAFIFICRIKSISGDLKQKIIPHLL